MFSVLPDLTPRDSHSLWYISSRSPIPLAPPDPGTLDPSLPPPHAPPRRPTHAAALLERTPLARLRADEALQDRRRQNISNFGATWLRPPGVGKSLFQIREERREAEEHAEALRREALALQLADAEGAGGLEGMEGGDLDGEPMGGEGEEGDGERDLDDEIPDADAGGFGYDGAGSDDDDSSLDGGGFGAPPVQRRLQHMRATEDRVRELMVRGQDDAGDLYGGEEIDDEDAAQMLEEEDLVHTTHDEFGEEGVMGMDADLDDDIPEAESGGYEHTDSEAEVTSVDDGGPGPSFAPPLAGRGQNGRYRGSLADSDGHSLDISSLLSGGGSSSPHVRRWQ